VEVTKTTTISVRAPGRASARRTDRPTRRSAAGITRFGCGSQLFGPVLPLFSDRFDCITYDNRAAGRSSTPLLPTSMPELAHDPVRVLDALGVDAAHVHGVSMGGTIAQEMALRYVAPPGTAGSRRRVPSTGVRPVSSPAGRGCGLDREGPAVA
jgi:hypothetical protein